MTKAIFFDLDGTLVSFQTHEISQNTLSALHALHNKGIKLFLSTGRHRRMIDYPMSIFPFDGAITLSGQYCTCGGRVLRSNPMTPAAVEELVGAARSNAFSCIFLEGEDIYLNRMTPNTQEFLKDLNLPTPALADPARALGRDVYQGIAFLTPEEEHLLLDRAPHLTTTRWHPHFLDVIPSGGGKDKGVDAVLEHLGIDLADSMAFGDGENDLSMLVHCGIGVAMGTASPAVQARADYVTGSVDEDGVVTALEHFGLL